MVIKIGVDVKGLFINEPDLGYGQIAKRNKNVTSFEKIIYETPNFGTFYHPFYFPRSTHPFFDKSDS